jgi:hypothetical protein
MLVNLQLNIDDIKLAISFFPGFFTGIAGISSFTQDYSNPDSYEPPSRQESQKVTNKPFSVLPGKTCCFLYQDSILSPDFVSGKPGAVQNSNCCFTCT